jgi:multiple sugar transport system substrate-binding protein
MFNGKSDSAQIITTAASRVGDQWQYGPDYADMFAEMQKDWGKVIKKQMTVKDMLTHLQSWTLADLKSKGVNASAAS